MTPPSLRSPAPIETMNPIRQSTTDRITIGRDPGLTLFVTNGIRHRAQKAHARRATLARITRILTLNLVKP